MEVKLKPADDWQYWYKKAEFYVDNLCRDRMTNIMLLASEFRNQFRLGIEEGISKSDNAPRD